MTPLPQEEDENIIIDELIEEKLFGPQFPGDNDILLEEQWNNQFEGE